MFAYTTYAQGEIPKNANRIIINSDHSLADVARILARNGYFLDSYFPDLGYLDTEWIPSRYKDSKHKRKFMLYKEDSVFVLSGNMVNIKIEKFYTEISQSGAIRKVILSYARAC